MLTVLRVYDYAPRKVDVLARAVLPVLSELRAEAGLPVGFLTRHWDGGSHLALHLGPGVPPVGGAARLRERTAALGEPRPAWSQQEYDAFREAHERIERRPARHLTPYPHGTVLEDRDERVFSAPDDVRHGLLTALAAVLGAELRPGTATRQAPGLALRLMLAVGSVYPGGLRFGSISYRSHAEAFLHSRADSAALRARFEQAYQRQAAGLRELLAGALADPGPLSGHTAFADAYTKLSDPVLAADIRDLLDSADTRHGHGPADRTLRSPFHRTLWDSGFAQDPPAGFLSYRLLVNWLYEVLPLLDVAPANRYLYCYCLAQAVDEQLGETWQERLEARHF
ncbi:lantibiotic dehydratase C-terminal domain-containing protein [Streptomyces sp. NPDC054834]